MKAKQRSRWMVCSVVGVLIGFLATLSPDLGAQSNPFLGSWKLNVAKSKWDPGPPLKSDDRVYELWEGDGVKAAFTQLQGDGTRATVGFAAHYDGKDYKYTGSPNYDSISIKRTDANTTESILKKDGKVVQTTKVVISNGGKLRTQTATGTNAKGQTVNNLVVWDKQ